MRYFLSTLCLLAVLARNSAQAQTANFVEIYADQSQVLVGRTLAVHAVVRDVSGNPIANAPVTWSVNQTAAASITQTGVVTAKALSTIRVTARSGSASGEAAIQSVPLRLEVLPAVTSVEVGSKTKFTAYAYDGDGNVIPNVPWTWSLSNLRQGGSSLGRVDTAGNLTATGEGGLWVWATYYYNESFPGLQQRWAAYSSVSSVVPRTYDVHKVFSTLSQTRSTWTLRPRQSMLWSTDDGQLYLNASLSGVANGLMNWNNGAWQVVSGGGVPQFGRSATALEFRTHAIARDGQILSYEDTNINGAELSSGNKNDLQPFLNNNVPLGPTEAVSSLVINRNSLTSTGWKLLRAAFRFPNEPIGYTGIFRGNRGVNEMLVSTKDTLPGITAAFSIDGDFGIAGDGTAFYSVTSGSTRIFYKHDFNQRTKLIGVGDSVASTGNTTSKVKSFLGGRTNEPATWFDEDGTAIVGVLLEDNTQWYLSFAPDGTMKSLRLTSQIGILWRNAAQGVLLYATPFGGQGNGAYLWKNDGTAATNIFLFTSKLLTQTIQEIESGTIDMAGRITLLVRGDRNALMAVRMDATPSLLFQDGDTINAELPVNLFTLIGGARTGPPHTQAGGNSGSISRFTGGDWETTLGIGERMFGSTTMWFGGSHGTTYNMRKAPNGDVWFICGLGIAKITPGGVPQLMISFPLKLDTLTVNNPGQLDVNDNGAVLFNSSTSAGDSRFFIWQAGQTKQILAYSSTLSTANTIDGRIASSFDTFALDTAGRVIAQLRFRGVSLPSLAIWDGSAWTTAAIPGTTTVGSHNVINLPTIVKAAGPHIVAGLTIETGSAILAEWQNGAWKILVDIDTIMPDGQVANAIASADVNTRGDVLFQFSNGVNSMVVLKDGKFRQVHDFFRPTPEGDWLLRINAMDLRDDGTVYFLTVNQFDEVLLYQADPVN